MVHVPVGIGIEHPLAIKVGAMFGVFITCGVKWRCLGNLPHNLRAPDWVAGCKIL